MTISKNKKLCVYLFLSICYLISSELWIISKALWHPIPSPWAVIFGKQQNTNSLFTIHYLTEAICHFMIKIKTPKVVILLQVFIPVVYLMVQMVAPYGEFYPFWSNYKNFLTVFWHQSWRVLWFPPLPWTIPYIHVIIMVALVRWSWM